MNRRCFGLLLAVCTLLLAAESIRARRFDPRSGVSAEAQGPRAWAVRRAWGPRSASCGPAPRDRQQAPDGCGPAALQAVLRGRGAPTTQSLLWSICRLPGGGTTLGRLAATARRFGVACAVRGVADVATVPFPAVLHLRRGHFVLLQEVGRDGARLLDPACGCVRVPIAELQRAASGAVLVFAPGIGRIEP